MTLWGTAHLTTGAREDSEKAVGMVASSPVSDPQALS